MPGVLPTINQQAIEYTVMTALALNCSIPGHTKFDRKNYPYPDLMKGYQISQYDAPLGEKGWLIIEVDGKKKKVGITRVHLEEDVAKLLHRTSADGEAYSLVDVNRSGVPLMEVVGEPDLSSPEEARECLVKLRGILQYLGVSTGNMEEGSFRCDANISIRPEGSSESLAKVEVKNMNSFRSVYRALEYEAKRQRRATSEGKRLSQETRGWVEGQGKTVSMRSKEYAHDYRYFPEPDLPPLVLGQDWVAAIRAGLPELPDARRERFITEYGLSDDDAGQLTGSKTMADCFESLAKAGGELTAKNIANWLIGPVSAIMNTNNIDIAGFNARVKPEQFTRLMALESQAVVNTSTGRNILKEMYSTGQGADDIIKKQGLSQISDTAALEAEVAVVINANSKAVSDYKAGKTQSLKFLVGQVMKATRGRADPNVVIALLKQKLEEG
jgi:aspartyl-tRNA(Asn)/glutamyl-tRNA(Gln) amidotransferase subunit B